MWGLRKSGGGTVGDVLGCDCVASLTKVRDTGATCLRTRRNVAAVGTVPRSVGGAVGRAVSGVAGNVERRVPSVDRAHRGGHRSAILCSRCVHRVAVQRIWAMKYVPTVGVSCFQSFLSLSWSGRVS